MSFRDVAWEPWEDPRITWLKPFAITSSSQDYAFLRYMKGAVGIPEDLLLGLPVDYWEKVVIVADRGGDLGDGSSILQTSRPWSPSFLGIIELVTTCVFWNRLEE